MSIPSSSLFPPSSSSHSGSDDYRDSSVLKASSHASDAIELTSASPASESGIPPLPQELLDQLNRERRRMQDLFGALAFALRSFKNLNQVLELIAFVASHLTDAEGGALVLFNSDGTVQLEQLHCSDVGKRNQIRSLMEKVTQNLSLQQARSGSQHSYPDQDQSSWVEQVLDQQFRQDLGTDVHLYGTPLLVRNQVRGRLYVFSRHPDFTWTEERRQLLRVIADQAAVAIENDELTVELRRRAALDKELEIGSEIQAQLLPRHYPQLPGIALAARCQTANKVGGDYYDFIEVTPRCSDASAEEPTFRRLGIVIGDVMGKGVPAGLLMTMTRGTLRAEILNDHNPAQILYNLNQVLFSDLENSNRFISLFYSDYDPVNRRLCFSNAAHNPTLWWQAATEEIHPLDTMGALLGLDQTSTYEERCVQLHPGDVVVYYTDGFTEAANARGERLEASGLEAAIRFASKRYQDPQQILESLFEEVDVFRHTTTDTESSQQLPSTIFSPSQLQDLPDEIISMYPPTAFRNPSTSRDDMTLVVLKVLPT